MRDRRKREYFKQLFVFLSEHELKRSMIIKEFADDTVYVTCHEMDIGFIKGIEIGAFWKDLS